MRYHNIRHALFLDRPNRFIAHVMLEGNMETVHVKNTGRCRELLLPGAKVLLEGSDNPNRSTRFDLVTVWKEGLGWVNIDSQAPNKIALEWLRQQGYDLIRPEYTYGSSRIDFYMEKMEQGVLHRILMEVKGCTLEIGGMGYFPDAPTERGLKHLRELTEAVKQGYEGILCFVIQMEGITRVLPNSETHAAFKEALEEAQKAGVKILYLPCSVKEDEVIVRDMG
ncbi:MAG: DNA/RNA nuclease SfsA [Lachnospiraceae bacterium]|nr:DNA/RNA nuclease SfsA [Lachnospiraceae bacterium]